MHIKSLIRTALIFLVHYDFAFSMEMEPPAKKQKIAEEEQIIVSLAESEETQKSADLMNLEQIKLRIDWIEADDAGLVTSQKVSGNNVIGALVNHLPEQTDADTEFILKSSINAVKSLIDQISKYALSLHDLTASDVSLGLEFIKQTKVEIANIAKHIEKLTTIDDTLKNYFSAVLDDIEVFLDMSLKCYLRLYNYVM